MSYKAQQLFGCWFVLVFVLLLMLLFLVYYCFGCLVAQFVVSSFPFSDFTLIFHFKHSPRHHLLHCIAENIKNIFKNIVRYIFLEKNIIIERCYFHASSHPIESPSLLQIRSRCLKSNFFFFYKRHFLFNTFIHSFIHPASQPAVKNDGEMDKDNELIIIVVRIKRR